MKGHASRQAGLTLIEVLIAAGIATVAGVLLIVIIANSSGLFTNHSSQVTEGLNINDALAEMRGAIKQSTAVEASSSVSQIVLKVSSVDASNNIIENTYDHFVFFLDKNILHFKVIRNSLSFRKDSDRVLSTLVDSLTFKYLNYANPPQEVTTTDATKVKVNLILKQRTGANFVTNIASTEANLRND